MDTNASSSSTAPSALPPGWERLIKKNVIREGRFVDGVQQGRGRLINLARGDVYEGTFVDNKLQGFTRLYRKDGTQRCQGLMRNNLFDGPATRFTRKRIPTTGLYQDHKYQRPLDLHDFASYVVGRVDEAAVESALRCWEVDPAAAETVKQTVAHGWTALHFVAKHHPQPHVVQRLLNLGADPAARSAQGANSLHLSCGYSAHTRQAVERLLCRRPHLRHFFRQHHLDAAGVNVVMAQELDPCIVQYRATRPHFAPVATLKMLTVAAPTLFLSEVGCGPVHAHRELALTALELAILAGDHEVVRFFLREGPASNGELSLRRAIILSSAIGDTPMVRTVVAESDDYPHLFDV